MRIIISMTFMWVIYNYLVFTSKLRNFSVQDFEET